MKNLIKTEIIANYLKEHNLSKTKFCRLCKISVSTFNKIMNGEDFDLIALFRIAKTIEVELYQLFQQK